MGAQAHTSIEEYKSDLSGSVVEIGSEREMDQLFSLANGVLKINSNFILLILIQNDMIF